MNLVSSIRQEPMAWQTHGGSNPAIFACGCKSSWGRALILCHGCLPTAKELTSIWSGTQLTHHLPIGKLLLRLLSMLRSLLLGSLLTTIGHQISAEDSPSIIENWGVPTPDASNDCAHAWTKDFIYWSLQLGEQCWIEGNHGCGCNYECCAEGVSKAHLSA